MSGEKLIYFNPRIFAPDCPGYQQGRVEIGYFYVVKNFKKTRQFQTLELDMTALQDVMVSLSNTEHRNKKDTVQVPCIPKGPHKLSGKEVIRTQSKARVTTLMMHRIVSPVSKKGLFLTADKTSNSPVHRQGRQGLRQKISVSLA